MFLWNDDTSIMIHKTIPECTYEQMEVEWRKQNSFMMMWKVISAANKGRNYEKQRKI